MFLWETKPLSAEIIVLKLLQKVLTLQNLQSICVCKVTFLGSFQLHVGILIVTISFSKLMLNLCWVCLRVSIVSV